MMTTESLATEILTLRLSTVLVETNEGTYGPGDVRRAGTTGGMSDYRIYEAVGTGARHTMGCDPARAPGYARRMGTDELREARRRLVDLLAQQRAARR